MAYEITGDLSRALQDVQNRLNSRYYDPSRSTANTLAEARIGEDQNRVNLLRQLQTLAMDPSRSAAINSGVDAQMAQARQMASDTAGTATGNVTIGAAANGMLGGSRINRQKGQIVAGADQSVRQAAGMAEDWRQGTKDADQNYLSSVMQSILDPSQSSQNAMGAVQKGFQTNLGLGQQMSDVNAQQSQLLAQSFGGFLQNTVAPGVSGAFQVAGARRDAAARGQPYRTAWQTLMSGG
jgi:hypothetical protein